MASRRINPNIVKINRTYSVTELARCCRVHKNTVLFWKRQGLCPIDDVKPILFQGSVVRDFLRKRNRDRKNPSGPGKLYCFRCRVPREPAGGRIEYVAVTPTGGNIRAICSICKTLMHRRVCKQQLASAMPNIAVHFTEPQLRLIGSQNPSSNCDSERQAAA